MTSRRVLVVLSAWAFAVTGALSGERVHTVRPGESASSIAKHYYGSFESTPLLLQFNGKTGPVIQPGEQLRIPFCERHVVRPGDTWSGLAEAYLGQPSAYTTVAVLNGVLPERALQVGQKLIMPVVLEHSLERGESLSSVAERFYGTTDLASVLTLFNEIENPRRLSVGQNIGVPIVTLVLEGEKPSPPPPPEPLFAEELRAAREAFDQAEFDRSRKILETLRGRIGSSPVAAERRQYWELAAFVHVAFNEPERACDAYRRVGAPSDRFDEDLVSPKILRTLGDCGA